MYKKFLAIDQYGQEVFIDKNPRKELLKHHGVQHADKMYRDDENGKAIHVGYIVAGHWYDVLKITQFKGEK